MFMQYCGQALLVYIIREIFAHNSRTLHCQTTWDNMRDHQVNIQPSKIPQVKDREDLKILSF